MRLTNIVIGNAKPQEKPYKLVDGRGLYVLVNKAGKYFRWDYRFGGKRKTLALGVYPEVSLKEAREKYEDLRRPLARDVDPMEMIEVDVVLESGGRVAAVEVKGTVISRIPPGRHLPC